MLALYGHPFSSYTWKAQIALHANWTPYELREVGPAHPHHTEFVQNAHPAGKFPVLVDGDVTVVEATAIIEYLAVAYPGAAALIPPSPGEAVTARMLDRVFDHYVMAPMQRVVSAYLVDRAHPDPAEITAGKASLERSYRWLEHWLGEHALPPHISLVSCAAAPALFYADWVLPIAEAFPRLRDLRATLLALPVVSRCVEAARPFRHWFPPGAPDRD